MVELPGKLYIVVCFGTLRKGDHFTYCVAYSCMPHHKSTTMAATGVTFLDSLWFKQTVFVYFYGKAAPLCGGHVQSAGANYITFGLPGPKKTPTKQDISVSKALKVLW